jgi:hypothetical protein
MRRVLVRDGGDAPARELHDAWMTEEIPFLADVVNQSSLRDAVSHAALEEMRDGYSCNSARRR